MGCLEKESILCNGVGILSFPKARTQNKILSCRENNIYLIVRSFSLPYLCMENIK